MSKRILSKRIRSIILSLCMVFTMLPVSAMAKEHTTIHGSEEIISFEEFTQGQVVPMQDFENQDEDTLANDTISAITGSAIEMEFSPVKFIETYNLWVCGTQVTSENASDVQGDGTVTYNPDTNTLTLNDANLTYSYGNTIYTYLQDLIVEFHGTNTVTSTSTDDDNAFNTISGGDITFRGTGSLNASGTYGGIYAFEDITIESGTITVTGQKASISSNSGTMTISGGEVTAIATQNGGYCIGQDHGRKLELTVSGNATVTAIGKNGAKATGSGGINYISTTHYMMAGDSESYVEMVPYPDDSIWAKAYVKLLPGNLISGTITSDGNALMGASIQIQKSGVDFGEPVITAADGTYITQPIPDGNYTIKVSKSGYIDAYIAEFTVSGASVHGKDQSLIEIISVTDITMNNTTSVRARNNLTLTGSVIPSNAINRTIIWRIENANGTGATINGNTLRTLSAGTVTVKATVVNGVSEGNDFSKTFTIRVTEASRQGSKISTPSEKTEGTVVKDLQQEYGAPLFTIINNSNELTNSVLTSEEMKILAEGVNARIILKVRDISATVSEEEKKLLQETIVLENGITETAAAEIPVLYVDLSLYKQIGGQVETRVTETNGKITISVEVPEKLWNTDVTKNREFYLIRIHNGEAIRIDGSYDAVNHLFTFETDRFSTFALAYQDAIRIKTYNDFHHLRLTAKAAKTFQTLTYEKVDPVDGYLIYGGKCGEEMSLLAEVAADITSYKVKGLKQGTSYKFQVKAYQIIDGEQVIIMTSKVIHSITESKTYANATKVSVNNASIKLEVGKSKTVSFQVVLPKGKKLKEHTAVLRYESTDKGIATVNSKGKITAKAKGSCYVYAYAQNGVYKRIKVTVK